MLSDRRLKKAIVTICPGGRQRQLLEIVWPTWQSFAKRFDIPIIVVDRPVNPEHVFWGKYFLFEMPELAGFDAILHLDNDVIINSKSSSPFVGWNPASIGVVDERSQQSLDEIAMRRYYHSYGIADHAIPPEAKIYNMGVFIFSRAHGGYFRQLYDEWRNFLCQFANGKKHHYLFTIADQPHVSIALQRDDMAYELDMRFNTLWWHWYRNNVSAQKLPFLLRSKAASLVKGVLPQTVWQRIFQRERALFAAAQEQCDFLHVAGSKSALYLGVDPSTPLQ